METAVSTACLYPLETARSLDTLLQLGFRRFEVFLNTESELDACYIDRLRAAADAVDAKILSVHPYSSGFEGFLFFSEYGTRFSDGVRQYRNIFRAARRLGAPVVVFHGDIAVGRLSNAAYYERFALLSQAAAEEGVILAQENVSRCRSRSVTFVDAMRRALGDRAHFVLDLKQARRADEDPLDMLRAMRSVEAVHLSAADSLHDCLPPGCGDTDFVPLLEALARTGYRGALTVEVYRDNFHQPEELADAKKYFDALLGRGGFG